MKLRYDNCPSCFGKLGGSEICPICSFHIENINLNPNVLLPFTLLNNRYLLGRMLGQGGFGITYIAQDVQSGSICAIKEYMPVEYAKRSDEGPDVVLNKTGSRQVYEHGKSRFLDEARTLYQLKENPSVVKILDFFSENNTAYLVMEYLDGINLKGEMNRNGGKIDAGYAKVILVTIASSMIEIHKRGILHRDISPENIFLTRNGEIKLIDFGSARSYVSSQQKNGMSVLLKPGFAPPEQYDSHGEQGPWTDVYSLASTFYYAVSGQKLPDSLYRQRGSGHVSLSELNSDITARTSRAIDKALELKISNRYPDFKRFLDSIDMDYVQEKRYDVKKEEERADMEARTKDPAIYTKKPVPPKKKIHETSQPPLPKRKKWFSFFRKTQGIPVVKIVDGRNAGQKFDMLQREIFKIGRSAQQCHMSLDYDSSISRVHCLLKYDDRKKGFTLLDMSNNGTFLENGERLEKNKSYDLEPGGRFYLVSKDNLLEVQIEQRKG